MRFSIDSVHLLFLLSFDFYILRSQTEKACSAGTGHVEAP
jgi:hypothetical protein